MSAGRWLRLRVAGLDVVVAASSFRRTVPAPAPLPAAVDVGGESYAVIAAGTLGGDSGAAAPELLLLFADGPARVAIATDEVVGRLSTAAEEPTPLPWPWDGGPAWCAGAIVVAAPTEPPLLALDLSALARLGTADPAAVREAAR